jgi:hypothetical protein
LERRCDAAARHGRVVPRCSTGPAHSAGDDAIRRIAAARRRSASTWGILCRVDRDEFQRRIEVYVENDLPDLASERERIAAVLAGRLWPYLSRWRAEASDYEADLRRIGQRLSEQWPDARRALQLESTGSEDGWLVPLNPPPTP